MDYDVIVLGAGISGITCSIYLKRAGVRVLIIENNMLGGQLNKAIDIENFPGYVSVKGVELSSMLLKQVEENDIDLVYDEVSSIDYEKRLVWVGNSSYGYKYLVFATGRRERRFGIFGEDELIGRGISFCASCDGALYRDREVAVVGGGSTALSEAIYLSKICKRVYLIYRGNEFRGEEALKDRVFDCDNIDIIYNREVIDYLVEDKRVVGVLLSDESKIRVDCVFLAIGQLPNSELFVGDKVDGYIKVEGDGQTSIDGVYACGDVIDKVIYQLVTASSDGVMVASSIIEKLR